MLQQMMDVVEILHDMLNGEKGEQGASEAAVAILADAAQLLEAMQDVQLEPDCLNEMNYEKADSKAVDCFMMLLEYFMVRGLTAEDVQMSVYKEIDKIVQVRMQVVIEQSLLNVIENALVLGEIEKMNELNLLELK